MILHKPFKHPKQTIDLSDTDKKQRVELSFKNIDKSETYKLTFKQSSWLDRIMLHTKYIAKHLLVFPTWILVNLFNRYASASNHPWHNKWFTLKSWAKGSSELNNLFSVTFWVLLIMWAIFITLVANNHF